VSSPIWGSWPDIYYCLTVTVVCVGRPLWREDRSVFCICCWPLPAQSFSGPSPVSDLRLPFSSPPTTRRVTVKVFEHTSTRVTALVNTSQCHTATNSFRYNGFSYNSPTRTWWKTPSLSVVKNACLFVRYLAMDICKLHRKSLLRHWFYYCVRVFRALPRNGSTCQNMFFHRLHYVKKS
jgi:hypothetical protein